MASEKKNLGYDDSPIIPGTTWRVHDGHRPQPRIVTPGTFSTQEKAGDPPSDAIILFDGSNFDQWVGRDGEAPKWKLEQDYMEVVGGAGNIKTRSQLGDIQLHLEFAAPVEVTGESQGRGNSGVFLMGLYEIQVLDCYDNPTYPDGTTGGLYGQCPPLVNACRKPGQWQQYDIIWEAPRWDDDCVIKPAYVTVLLNGIVLHHRKSLQGPTKHKQTTEYVKHPSVGPLELQDHRDAVRFRNIWYRPLTDYDQG
ncbi:MAG: DUF1080 domain-containing protein [Armatimonadetes bacterium]|nr:DUF1080 domain-containing protein [Armatimonadota bacterium]